jgi:glycosyltransferase involved in cell wall biosynthesis
LRLAHLTPGTGSFYCGTCIRDNALVVGLRRLGHDVLMVPLYLPHVVDEEDTSTGCPVFFGGVNAYLQQKAAFFRRTPRWIDALFDTAPVLRGAARMSGSTRPQELGDMTLSMLQGEAGRQSKELRRLVGWLKQQPPFDAVCISNALLAGMAREIREQLKVPVICSLQGEDTFLDAMGEPWATQSWDELAKRAADVDVFVAVSRTYAELMQRRMRLEPGHVRVVPNGISVEGYTPAPQPPSPPTIGYLARLCRDKGLHTLVDAFCLLAQDRDVRLQVAGAVTALDEPFVAQQQQKLADHGLLDRVTFHPNIDRAQKQAILSQLTVFSVPATYGESFGLYVLEALASGVPVVEPRHGAFPELLAATGGGLLCAPDDPASLAAGLATLLDDAPRRQALAERGRASVLRDFTADRMAQLFVEAIQRGRN